MRLINLISILFILGLLPNLGLSQDIHLAHIHASPTNLNPALNGLFNGDIRFIGNIRSQWNSVTNGYKTVVASADMKLVGLGTRDYLSGGIQLYADRAGDLNFSTKSASLAFSYLKSMDSRNRSFVAFGMQTALVNNSVDFTKVSSYHPIEALSNGSVMTDNIYYWDFSAGAAWFHSFDKYNAFYAGVTLSHINNPIVSFMNSESPERAQLLYRKLVVHGGGTFKLTQEIDIKPTAMFLDQGPHKEINTGSFVRYRTQHNKRKKPLYFIYVGAWARWYMEHDISGLDAIIVSARMDYENFYVTASYDINVSKWALASTGRGGLELSIVKKLNFDRNYRKKNKVKCPVL